MNDRDARELLMACFLAGVAAVDPEEAVAGNLTPVDGRVVVFALGKAAPAMARGAARALRRDRLEGLVVSNYEDDIPDGLELIVGGHPVPNADSLLAGNSLLAMADSLGEQDTALVLISGGGSALAEAPVPGIGLDDLAATNRALLSCGADITTTNIIRRKLSRLKGGGLAAAIAPAKIITLIVSDVVGDDPATIASGPTVTATDPPGAALDAVTRFRLASRLPASVLDAIGRLPQDRPGLPVQQLRLVAGAATAAHAAAVEAEGRGFPAHVLDTRVTGNTGSVVGEVLERSRFGVSVFAGETTVDVTGAGIGGRNQEAALVAATLIDGIPDIWFLAAGTDGIDGMTDAAGAIVDGGTVDRAGAAGVDADRSLEHNDSGTFFATLREQVITGPTGTNVGDLWLVLRD